MSTIVYEVRMYVHVVILVKNTPRRPVVLTEDGEANELDRQR
jgi:hypothetical protein